MKECPPGAPASRSTPHRRAGKHRVPKHLQTGTHWDDKTHKELMYAIRSPSRKGLYRKDMPKHEMARALAEDDKLRKRARMKQNKEMEKRMQEVRGKRAEIEKANEQARAMARRERERGKKRADGEEDVSDTTVEKESQVTEYTIQGVEKLGTMASSEDGDTWSESDESSDPGTTPSVSPTFPHQKLRIYEWPLPDMPSPGPPPSPYTPGGTEKQDVSPEVLPFKIPYAVMNLVTSVTRETLELPGRAIPHGVGANFVPKLSQEVIDAARNGCLIRMLRKAKIESGLGWAARTQVQGWNG
ncbi:uncharacterized protein BDR25DRAFT_278094, partial [Lindgomyces ingoldianus]